MEDEDGWAPRTARLGEKPARTVLPKVASGSGEDPTRQVPMKISQAPHPIEAELDDECREMLSTLRRDSLEHQDEDPNDWLSQICAHLRRTPAARIERWTRFSNSVLTFNGRQSGVLHSAFRPRRVIRTLLDFRVDFVLVGMGAAYLQGVPYPTYNTDITPRADRADNVDRMWQALRVLGAESLERDEWGSVPEPNLPGFRRFDTTAGMVNIVDTLPGVGDYNEVMRHADLLNVGCEQEVRVASLRDVVRSKEAVGDLIVGDAPYSRMVDGLHVLMCRETLNAKAKYGGTKWNP